MAIAALSSSRSANGWVPDRLATPHVVRFAKNLDSLLDLLAATADGLAAAWNLQKEGISIQIDFDATEISGRRFRDEKGLNFQLGGASLL